ncbi:hypothetical protein ACWCXH_01655 [Kitasatospora sp. NPDC001660]
MRDSSRTGPHRASRRAAGWGRATAPGHVEEVRRLVFDPLTQAQQRTLRAIGHRVNQAIDPADTRRPD